MESKDAEGALCLRKPWPGMARTIWGSHERFLETYFKPYPGQPLSAPFFQQMSIVGINLLQRKNSDFIALYFLGVNGA